MSWIKSKHRAEQLCIIDHYDKFYELYGNHFSKFLPQKWKTKARQLKTIKTFSWSIAATKLQLSLAPSGCKIQSETALFRKIYLIN